jgi:hypothetical protein
VSCVCVVCFVLICFFVRYEKINLENSEHDGIQVRSNDRHYYYSPKWEMTVEGLQRCAI